MPVVLQLVTTKASQSLDSGQVVISQQLILQPKHLTFRPLTNATTEMQILLRSAICKSRC